MTAEETIDHLEGQLKDALERLKEMSERLRETEEHLQQAQARIAELEKQKTSPHRSLGQQEEGGRSGEEAAQKAGGPIQSWAAPSGAYPDCGTSDRDLPGLPLALGWDQFSALPRGH